MKTAIYMPDLLYRKAEKLAKNLKISRSELYQNALMKYLDNFESDKITAKLNSIHGNSETVDTRFLAKVAKKTFRNTEW